LRTRFGKLDEFAPPEDPADETVRPTLLLSPGTIGARTKGLERKAVKADLTAHAKKFTGFVQLVSNASDALDKKIAAGVEAEGDLLSQI
jgi:hypothetical protein